MQVEHVNTKVYIAILASSFGLMILGSVVGGILESSGAVTRESLGAQGITLILIIYFALFLISGFAIVPLALRFFISMQIKIGNGEFFLIKFLKVHEQAFVWCVWGLYITGLAIIFLLAKNDIIRQFK
jgi:hypothetical protein